MQKTKDISKASFLSLYWKCQLLGWGAVSTYWAYTVYFRDQYGPFYTALNYVLDIAIGVALTHFYRFIAKRYHWSLLPLAGLTARVIPSIILLSFLYMELVDFKWHLYWVYIREMDYTLWYSMSYWDPVFITGLRLMAIWILAYHLYHYHQNKLETARLNADLQLIAKQAQLDHLSNQLNPHFLFNSLNSIKSLISESPDTARRAVDLLSDLLRTSLYEKEVPFITLREELELVKDYIDLEKIRFEERLSISVTMDPELENCLILPLSIQLLVENGIKHGIARKISGGNIRLNIEKRDDQVVVTVQNPGSISKVEQMTGIGVKNLTRRLQLHYEQNADFTLENEGDDLVTATLTFPLRK
ncbi:sensor histidine kinase [Jiulongibacter sediminis]|uniref:Histidine kinase n=1 Tax=Jiulongibacter sediminis TaxID=1605367 RepID=A0A0N8H9L2_9BACT|nr:histidine kinase [Jiulongibacter sediminis]KPM47684.1 histidine kinase [Jiulongibacter sediminis]TBX23478.1 histidine kinase [Jiulongibacter sediminis]